MSTIMWKVARTTFKRVDAVVGELLNKLRKRFDEVDDDLEGKSDTGHTHDDRYYTEGEVDTALSGKSDTSHTHDDRYYTETQSDTLLNAKQDSHAFLEDIANLGTPVEWDMIVYNGSDWVVLDAPPTGSDLYLKWNDTTSVIEWGT